MLPERLELSIVRNLNPLCMPIPPREQDLAPQTYNWRYTDNKIRQIIRRDNNCLFFMSTRQRLPEQQNSNLRPLHPKCSVLPTELCPEKIHCKHSFSVDLWKGKSNEWCAIQPDSMTAAYLIFDGGTESSRRCSRKLRLKDSNLFLECQKLLFYR